MFNITFALSLVSCAAEMTLDNESDTENFHVDAAEKGGFPGGGFPGGGLPGGGFPGGGFPGGGFPLSYCGGENTGGDYSDGTSMGGPDLLLGMEFTADSDMTMARIDVFTGEESGTNTVGVWTDDGGEPGAEIATGSWTMDSTNRWQGALLDDPVDITADTTYWIVWGPINTSQASLQDSGTTVTYRGSFDAGGSWNGPYYNPWKFRFFCL